MRRLLLRTASMAVVAEVDVVRSGACQAVCSRIRVAGAIRRGGEGVVASLSAPWLLLCRRGRGVSGGSSPRSRRPGCVRCGLHGVAGAVRSVERLRHVGHGADCNQAMKPLF